MSLRLLVLDAYDAAGRQALQGAGATLAGELYRRMLQALEPDATIDVAAHETDGFRPPAELASYDGITWTGSNLTIHRDTPAVRQQLDLARAAFAAGVPSFGSCWAVHIAVTAAGGACAANRAAASSASRARSRSPTPVPRIRCTAEGARLRRPHQPRGSRRRDRSGHDGARRQRLLSGAGGASRTAAASSGRCSTIRSTTSSTRRQARHPARAASSPRRASSPTRPTRRDFSSNWKRCTPTGRAATWDLPPGGGRRRAGCARPHLRAAQLARAHGQTGEQTMKSRALLLMLVALSVLTACSDDDDDRPL
jgi:hypothetical protein